MKPLIHSFFILLLCILSSCDQKKPTEKTSPVEHEWRELSCGLFINTKGDLAFASDPEIAFTPRNELEGERCPNVFLTTFGDYSDSTTLRQVIDTSTFQSLGADMYKDRNHLYHYYAMCDGGYFRIFSDDTTGFTLLGATYFKYQSTIYHQRYGPLQADPETFVVFDEIGQIAKDKDGYFSFYERVSEEELRERLGEELFQQLKAME